MLTYGCGNTCNPASTCEGPTLVLTLRLMSSFRVAWKLLDAIRTLCYYGTWLRRRSVRWSDRHQVASCIHDVLIWVLKVVS